MNTRERQTEAIGMPSLEKQVPGMRWHFLGGAEVFVVFLVVPDDALRWQ